MWLDVFLVGLLAVFALLGSWRGALESGLRLVALAASYGAAVFAAGRWGPGVAEALGVPPLLGMPLAGTAAFLGCHLLFHVVLVLARSADRDRRAGLPRTSGDRALGGIFGLARGAIFALLLAWLGLVAGVLRETQAPVAAVLPDPTESALAQWSGRVVGAGAREAFGGDASPGAAFAGALAANPADTLVAARRVLAHPGIVELQRDGEFWNLLENGSADFALARPSYRALAADPGLRAELASLGMIDAEAASDPSAFTAALRPALEEVGARLARLRTDPEVQALLHDPEIAGLIEQGDTLGLLTHPSFQDLVRRVTTS